MKLPFRKLRRNQKGGVSVVVAVIMAMVVMVSFVQNILIWEQILRTEDIERLNERVEIEPMFFNSDGNLTIDVKNIGEVPTHLVGLWVLDNRTDLDYYLNVQEPYSKIMNVSHLGLTSDDTFIVTVVTERGTLDTTTYSPEQPPQEVKDVGVFKANWFYCRYSSEQSSKENAVVISKGEEYVAFYLNFTNTWIYPCTIQEESFLALTSLETKPPKQPNFFIVKDLDYTDFTISAYENEIDPYIVNPQESIELIFASKEIGGSDWKWGGSDPFVFIITEASGIQISLFFEMNGVIYGQTISTQATILRAS